MKPRLSRIFPFLPALCFIAGCVTKNDQTQQAPTAPKDTQAVKVEGVGSWIPRKVKSKKDIIGDGTVMTDSRAMEQANAAGRAVRNSGN